MKNDDSIPDFLIQARDAIEAAGFKARAYCGEVFGTGLNKIKSQGIQVTVKNGDPRIDWSTNRINVTPFVTGYHPDSVIVESPTGFEYGPNSDGNVSLSSSLPDKESAESFALCFTNPFGLDGKIVGPRAKPNKPVSKRNTM